MKARKAKGKGKANTWQGDFPGGNTLEDGYLGAAPAASYEPNALGFYNMIGNVWEWVDSSYKRPKGQQERQGAGAQEELTLKGGSFVDSLDGTVNHKATAATRMGNTADSGGVNTGFRCARGRGGRRRGSDPELFQSRLQEIMAEGGADALREHLAARGMSMATGADLRRARDEL